MVDLKKNNRASYFTNKISLFRNGRELQFETSKLWPTVGRSGEQRRGFCFSGGKKEAGRSSFKAFRVVVASHWLRVAFLIGWAGCQSIFNEAFFIFTTLLLIHFVPISLFLFLCFSYLVLYLFINELYCLWCFSP